MHTIHKYSLKELLSGINFYKIGKEGIISYMEKTITANGNMHPSESLDIPNTKGKLKNVIKGCMKQYDLDEITVICGYEPLYSGSFQDFYNNCDASMVMYRNSLLGKKVIAKSILSNRKLFVFLTN